jgi:hypothetical protein
MLDYQCFLWADLEEDLLIVLPEEKEEEQLLDLVEAEEV